MNDQAPEHSPASQRLLALIVDLHRELNPGRPLRRQIGIDSRLDRDLGFDSLARVELLLRVQRDFDASLPEALLGSAETPRDLLAALLARSTRAGPAQAAIASVQDPATVDAPDAAATLTEVLQWHADQHPDRAQVVLLRDDEEQQSLSYGDLLAGARNVAAHLQSRGLQPGETVALMLPTSVEYFFTFFGVLFAGGIPVPLYPPARMSQLEDHLRRQAGVLSNSQSVLLVTVPEARGVARLLRTHAPLLRTVITTDELGAAAGEPMLPRAQADDIAFLQYTSGSTGNPKGVILSHANLLANVRAMGEAVEATSNDVFVSWLPLYHDMGLIGAWFGSMYYGFPLVVMSPLAFLTRPSRWFRAIHRHRGTMSAAPNFAYELCLRKIGDSELQGLDLSSWRLAFNGAEAVSADTVSAFRQRFGKCGLRAEAITPVYGLAECSVGLAFPPLGRGPLVDHVARERFMRTGAAVQVPPDAPDALHFVSGGRPLPGHQLRIVDDAGREVGDRIDGRLQFKGPSTTRGYFRNAEATRALYRGEWLDSGDMAYIVDGELFPTGRAKDLVIRAGRNLFPDEIELAVGAVAGIRRGCVAVFGSRDPHRGTERLVVLAESRESNPQKLDGLRARVNDAVIALIGEPPDEVVVVRPHTVLKTSSGKIRRQASRALYEQGNLEQTRSLARWRMLRFAWEGRRAAATRWWRGARAVLYASWAWSVFGALAAVSWIVIMLLPGMNRRRAAARAFARAVIRATGTPFYVDGLENLPAGPSVIVANHSSYADGVVLFAALPRGSRLAFVAKRELRDRPAARMALARIGAVFVERADAERSVQDAREIARLLDQGESPVFFPEGTLQRAPGLMPFRLGGFMLAAEADVPVVPVAIRGTRSVLRGGQWFPRRGAVSVAIGAPLNPGSGTSDKFAAALKLRDAARAYILKRSGEPEIVD